MTHFSQDPLLLDILRKGGDAFTLIGAEWFNKPEAQVTKQEREQVHPFKYYTDAPSLVQGGVLWIGVWDGDTITE
jgi:hypothetical protein